MSLRLCAFLILAGSVSAEMALINRPWDQPVTPPRPDVAAAPGAARTFGPSRLPAHSARRPVDSGFDEALIGKAAQVPHNGNIHVLIIGDERDKNIGRGVMRSRDKLVELLKYATEPDPASSGFKAINVYTIGFEDALDLGNHEVLKNMGNCKVLSIECVEEVIARIHQSMAAPVTNLNRPTIPETILCFALAHGAYDPGHRSKDYEYGQFFSMQEGKSYARVQLFQTLKNVRRVPPDKQQQSEAKPDIAKLVVLLSDSCNVISPMPDFPEESMAFHDLRVRVENVLAAPALRSLLLKHTGEVSINAASPGQFSFSDAAEGGFFMQAFENVVRTSRKELSWHELFVLATDETQKVFDAAFKCGCPYAWDSGRYTILELLPCDPRTQYVLQPFATRPLTWVAQDDVHVAVHPAGAPAAEMRSRLQP
jgi:hypothetical protein